MRLGVWLVWALVLATLPDGTARAEAPRPSLGEARGLGAVGRLDFGDLAFCTGALIAPQLVLTAAHCLFDPEGRAFDASEIRFLAGARQGRALASRWVEAVFVHPAYDDAAAATSEPRARADDLALLLLDAPVTDRRIVPFSLGAPPLVGERVSVVSYAFDRPEDPAIENSCVMLEQTAGLLVLTCDVDFGASGAPVLVRRQGKTDLVSMIAAKAEADGRKVALGTKLDVPLTEVLRLVEAAGHAAEVAPVLTSKLPRQ